MDCEPILQEFKSCIRQIHTTNEPQFINNCTLIWNSLTQCYKEKNTVNKNVSRSNRTIRPRL